MRRDGGCGCAGSIAMGDIWRAARVGDVDEVEWLVGQDSRLLNARDEFGYTPLVLAAREGHLGVVRWLVENGAADPRLLNARDETYGYTPWMWAIRKGHLGVVRWLVEKGAAIDVHHDLDGTALYMASLQGRAPVVRMLVERGADPAIAVDWRKTPLMIASEEGHLEVVRVLLDHPSAKATIHKQDISGRTALGWACYKGRGGVVRTLLESGADPKIAHRLDPIPTAIAKEAYLPPGATAEGRRECVAALEVSLSLPPSLWHQPLS
jgi:uncharacterized protein